MQPRVGRESTVISSGTMNVIVSLALMAVIQGCSPDSGVAPLIKGEPRFQDIPSHLELGGIVAGSPRQKFSALGYESYYVDREAKNERLAFSAEVEMVEQEESVAVTRTEYFIVNPDGTASKRSVDVDVGIPGFVSFVHLTTKYQPPRAVRFRRAVRRIENLDGELFPMEEGKELSFDMVCAYQSSRGEANSAVQELAWSYRYRIIESYEDYSMPGLVLPGRVFVIEREEVEPGGERQMARLHLSEPLGVVLRTELPGDDVSQDIRLVTIED